MQIFKDSLHFQNGLKQMNVPSYINNNILVKVLSLRLVYVVLIVLHDQIFLLEGTVLKRQLIDIAPFIISNTPAPWKVDGQYSLVGTLNVKEEEIFWQKKHKENEEK